MFMRNGALKLSSLMLGVFFVVLGLAVHADATLTAYWNFNETSGTTAANSANWGVPTDLNGTLTGGAAFVTTGKFGNAVTFDGSNDYVDVTHKVIADGGHSYTASVWINVPNHDTLRRNIFESTGADVPTGYVISAELTATNHYLKSSTQVGGIAITATSSVQPSVNTWHLITVAVDNSAADKVLRLYYDGQQVASANAGQNPLDPTTGFHIGTYRGANDRWYLGLLDDMAVWDTTLNPGQIKSMVNILDVNEGALSDYDTGRMDKLFQAFAGTDQEVTSNAGSLLWTKFEGISGTAGSTSFDSGAYYVWFTGSSGVMTVPEPATTGLLAVGGLGLLFRKKR